MRLIFVFEYDGSRFAGYQIQPDRVTVQGEFEQALAKVLGQPTRTIAAGRTDRGVHALGQVAACTTDARIPLPAILQGMNARLPVGIRLRSVQEGSEDFHPRFRATRRAYRYVMTETMPRSVLLDPYVTHLERPLDWPAVRDAAARLEGLHNLVSFAKDPSRAVRLEREIESIEFGGQGGFVFVDFRARAFLRGQIRNMMGWLIAVGRGEATPGDITELLAAREKTRSVEPAPPQGLYLMRVWYPGDE